MPGLGEEAGAALAEHPGVRHLSFTGSVTVGALVQAAAARHVAPVTLELGGKSPQIVFADADLDRALPFLVNAGIQNAGQTCSAASRILVERSRYREVVERMAERYRALRVGPADADLDVGPLISGAAEGDRLRLHPAGGRSQDRGRGDDRRRRAERRSLRGADPVRRREARSSLSAQEEIFGPVQVAIPFNDEAEAVGHRQRDRLRPRRWRLDADGGRQMRLAKALRSGQVFINNYGAGGGVELPFGGVGKSGHGREKGFEALYGFST